RVIRTDRGNLSRPTVEDIYKYRKYVDHAMNQFLQKDVPKEIEEIVTLGFNHEQQHQELLMTDIKYILGNNPLFPAYRVAHNKQRNKEDFNPDGNKKFLKVEEGIYEIG